MRALPKQIAPSRKLSARILADGALVFVLVVWWSASRGVASYVLPSPIDVAYDLARFVYDPTLLQHLFTTMIRVCGAVVLSTVLGALLALVAFWWPWTSTIIESRIVPFINSIPTIGWAIVGVVWFDVSNAAVMFVQVAILLPFCVVNVLAGLKQLDGELLEMGRSFTRSRRLLFLKITLPLLTPFIFASTRMALGMAWKLSLVSELFGASAGLGVVMLNAQESGDAALVMATCCMVVVAYVVTDRLFITPLAACFETGADRGEAGLPSPARAG